MTLTTNELRFALAPVDRSYFETAPMRWRHEMHVAVDADEVWRQLTVQRPLSWCRAITDIAFDGEPPYGIGARRGVEALRALRLREYFFHWDDAARQYSFYATSSNLPLFRSFAEDYDVRPTADGCTFTWTFALTPRPGMGAPGRPLNAAIYSSFARDTRKRFGAR